MEPFEGFTEADKFVIQHKTKAEIINGVNCPYYLSCFNHGIFKDMNYPPPRLSLTRFKYYKLKILTFATEEAADKYLMDNREYTDIDQLKVVLRITPEENAAKEAKRARRRAKRKLKNTARETGNWEEYNKHYPLKAKLKITYEVSENDDDDDDDFESKIMRDLENGDGDIHGL